MKKFFAFVAAALVAFSFASCNKGGGKDASIKINITENVKFDDYVATEGWWQVMAQDENYYVTLSNGNEITAIAGTYQVADLDPDFSYITVLATEEQVAFTEGFITVTVEDGGKKVTVIGTLTGEDENVYELNIVYIQPEVKKTVNVNIAAGSLYEGYGEYGLWAVYGQDEATYVQLALWAEDELQGDFTDADLDNKYLGSYVYDLATEKSADVYTAAISIVPSNDNTIAITADLLCYNNTLYKVAMITPAPSSDEAATAPKKAPKKFAAKKGAKKL